MIDCLRQTRAYVTHQFRVVFGGEIVLLLLFCVPQCLLTCILEWMEKQEIGKAAVGEDEDSDIYEGFKVPTRISFLRINVQGHEIPTEDGKPGASIAGSPGNVLLRDLMLANNKTANSISIPKKGTFVFRAWMKIEKKEDWAKFPHNLYDVPSITEGPGLELMGWLVFLFGPSILSVGKVWKAVLSEASAQDCLPDFGMLVDKLTADDMAFIFLQIETNINKWLLQYKAWKTNKGLQSWKTVKKWKKLDVNMKRLKKEEDRTDANMAEAMEYFGCEFFSGAGFSKTDAGQQRYYAVKKLIKNSFYSSENGSTYTAEVEKARENLRNEVRRLRQEELISTASTSGEPSRVSRKDSLPNPFPPRQSVTDLLDSFDMDELGLVCAPLPPLTGGPNLDEACTAV